MMLKKVAFQARAMARIFSSVAIENTESSRELLYITILPGINAPDFGISNGNFQLRKIKSIQPYVVPSTKKHF